MLQLLNQMKAVLLLASMLFVSYADDEFFSVDVRSSRRHYCGKELRRTLMFLCDSIYKRSSSEVNGDSPTHSWPLDAIGAQSESYDDYHAYPFRSRAKALSVMPIVFRRTARQGGVADECCSKPCSISELQTYCGPKTS